MLAIIRLHRMKLKIILVTIAILVICAFASAYHAARTIADYEATASEVSSLIVLLGDYFGSEHNQYPSSLVEAVSRLDSPFRERAEHLLHDKWNDKYEYHPVATGFVLVVRGYRFEYQMRPNGYVIMGRFTTNVVTVR